MRPGPLALLIVSVVGLAAIGAALWVRREPGAHRRSCPGGVVSVTATGDIMLGADVRPARPAMADTRPLLASADIALGSLAMTLLDRPQAADPRGPAGGGADARLLRRWGFTVLSRANDHAADFGREGIDQTGAILQRNRLASAGVGADLAAARQPTWLATPCGPVAVIAVATSLHGEDPAVATRPGIAGRPGANPLRYTMRVELDPATYRTLSQHAAQFGGPPPDAQGRLSLFGKTLAPGAQTQAVYSIDPQDEAGVLAVIRQARRTAVLVVVSLHSHEPDNAAVEPAAFAEAFARRAVEAGAGLVVGHGPHRLRPLEIHDGGLIAYSLGDFAVDSRLAASLAGNPFDAAAPSPTGPQGAVLSAAFKNGRLVSAQLAPLDLSAANDQPAGFPRRVPADRTGVSAADIVAGSAARGASLTPRDGHLEVAPVPRRAA